MCFRFIPTCSGELHFGHYGAMCLIDYMAKNKNMPVKYIIDDLQVSNWKLYDKDLSGKEIEDNCETISSTISSIFPDFEDEGRFTSDKYISAAENLIKFNAVHNSIVERNEITYCVPDVILRKTMNDGFIFNALKCFYKIDNDGNKIWNPYYLHAIVNFYLGVQYQVVDTSLYCPYKYAYDSHDIPVDYYNFWIDLFNFHKYEIFLHPRIVTKSGKSISKSNPSLDLNLNILPLETFQDRINIAFGTTSPILIGKSLYEASNDLKKDFKLHV